MHGKTTIKIVYWIFGEAGVGKTKWWDGYHKQETTLMYDF
jgi:hypothetical protein